MEKTVLITGATSGIGYSTAELFLKHNWTVIATGRNRNSLEKLSSLGAHTMILDVTNEKDIDTVFNDIELKFSRLDVLVNNAGYGQFGSIEETDDKSARKQFDTNVFGLAAVTRRFLPLMRKYRTGRIINVSSIAGRISIPCGGWYAGSKHAVEAISDALRWEVKQFGIKVIVIQPGPIKTGFSTTVKNQMAVKSENSPYDEILKAVLNAGNKSSGGKVESCAKTIYKAASSKRPKIRYILTKEAWLIKIILFTLPQRLIDNIIHRAIFKDKTN